MSDERGRGYLLLWEAGRQHSKKVYEFCTYRVVLSKTHLG
jgi:hypothetical protein